MDNRNELVELTAEIVAAYVGNNPVSQTDLPRLIGEVYKSLTGATTVVEEKKEEPPPEQKPAVAINRSVSEDYIICLEDGKRFKSLKRHLMTHYNMTPDQYRNKWGLKPTYPMVARSYAAKRSALAKKIGLGRKAAA